jgi:hypothetical protein
MRIYIIGNDGITLSREAPATMTEGELPSPQRRNCTPPRSAANGFWHCGTPCPGSKSGKRSVIVRH